MNSWCSVPQPTLGHCLVRPVNWSGMDRGGIRAGSLRFCLDLLTAHELMASVPTGRDRGSAANKSAP